MWPCSRRKFLTLLGAGALTLPFGPLYGAPSRALFEPPDGRVYHGVGQVLDRGAVSGYLEGMGSPTLSPLIEKLWTSIPGTRGLKLNTVRSELNEVAAAGRVAELSIAFKRRNGASDVAIAETGEFDILIDELAAVVRQFNQPLFVRPGFEFNGPWNDYTPVAYVSAFRKIVTRFRQAGVSNAAFIWCYEPDAPDNFDVVENGRALWYPGDEFVDWFGHDVFKSTHFDPASAQAQRGAPSPQAKTERFLSFASDRGKPVFLSETSAWFVNITPTADDPGLIDGKQDWESWFQIYFDWMAAHSQIKAFCYLNEDWTTYKNPKDIKRGNTHIENNAFILERYREEMQQVRYIHQPEGLFSSTV